MSKKSGSVFVSAAGLIAGFVDKLISKFQALGGTDEQLHELFVGKKSDDFIAGVVNLAMKMAGAVRDNLYIVVDYSRTLFQMIRAGDYDSFDDGISSGQFPVKGEGKVKLIPEFVHYAASISSEEIIEDMNRRGLRPSTLPELLAYGEKNPEEQRECPIVELGSICQNWCGRSGHRRVACLSGNYYERRLGSLNWGDDWRGPHRFLAFRK